MDALEALLGRASPPRLTTPGPTGEQLELLLQAGARAPDHGRMRPFRFLIIEAEARERLGGLLAAALERREPNASAASLNGERRKALRAPAIIVVAAAVRPNPKVPEIEQIVAAGAAAENMLLAAHAMGLGGFWRTGASAYDPAVKAGLGFSEADRIVGFLYFGTPVGPTPARPSDTAELARWF